MHIQSNNDCLRSFVLLALQEGHIHFSHQPLSMHHSLLKFVLTCIKVYCYTLHKINEVGVFCLLVCLFCSMVTEGMLISGDPDNSFFGGDGDNFLNSTETRAVLLSAAYTANVHPGFNPRCVQGGECLGLGH